MGTTNILKQINKKYQSTIIDLAFINSNKILINKEIEDLRKDIFMNQTVYDHALLASLCLLVDKTDCPFLSLEPYLYGIGNKDKRFF